MSCYRSLILVLLLGCLFQGVAVSADRRGDDGPWTKVPEHPPHTDHSGFFTEPFPDGPSVTRACLKCHEGEAKEVMQTAHWNLLGEEVIVPGHEEPMRIGKRNLINNFCIGIRSNWPGCTTCHIGYGFEDENFDFTDETRVDCLACHDNSGAYAKKKQGAGRPDPGVDLLAVAKSVGWPRRGNCGMCHFMGGGANAVKHGDLDNTLLFPSAGIDVHMGELDFQCVDCHRTERHQIKGRATTVSVDNTNRGRCTDCHAEKPHHDVRVNAHTDRVACQTCHIPFSAVKDPTKLTWDWSEAGQDLGITDEHIYLKIKGRFTYGRGIRPEYYWFNETSGRYILGDRIDPLIPTRINPPQGSRDDPASKIHPFKVHRGKQIYDVKNNYFILPHVHGNEGFWTKFDWPTAARIGSELTGLPFSGRYGFAPTEMFMHQNHMTVPAERALQCRDCHGEHGRLDWIALDYDNDPLGRPKLEHMPFPLMDADFESVFDTGKPLSTAATCGLCHDVETEDFVAKHAYHDDIDLEALPPGRQILMREGPRIAGEGEGQMNCFLCHLATPNLTERLRALEDARDEWSVTATLVGTGLVARTDAGGYEWKAEAAEGGEASLGIGYVSEANCGGCHGAVHDGADPLLVAYGKGAGWTTEKTGQVFSPQRIRSSGMNIRGKDALGQAFDVHAERLVQCGDCHYSKDRPARLAGEVSPEAAAHLGEHRRRCDSCHSVEKNHDWLPEQERHFKAVACEACHVPQLHMAAQEQVDNTVVGVDGRGKVVYRGVEGDGYIERPAEAYIDGYRPVLLVGRTGEGGDRLIPYNLVSEWYWIDGANGERVSQAKLQEVWLKDGNHRPKIVAAFDLDADGILSDEELRLDSPGKVETVKALLMRAGVAEPRIEGEVRSYHIHHNVVHGDLVNRDCTVCHAEDDETPPPFELAHYVPGGVVPELVDVVPSRLGGRLEVAADGRLELLRDRDPSSSYKALAEEQTP